MSETDKIHKEEKKNMKSARHWINLRSKKSRLTKRNKQKSRFYAKNQLHNCMSVVCANKNERKTKC